MSDDEVVVVDKDGDFDGAAPESDDPSSAEECDDGGDDDEISGRPRKKARSTAAAVTPSGKKSKAKSSKGAASPAASAASSRAAAGGGKAGHAAPAAKKGGAAASAGSSSAGAAAGVGGPPGSLAPIAFKKANTVAEAEAILLSYLRRGNRPYSALQVFENLHGAVGKSVVPAVLDRLAESGQACAKSFGKFKLYWAEQSQFGETGKVTALGSAMSATELAAALAQTRSQVAALQSRLARFEGPDAAPLVMPQERAAAVAALDKYRRAWASRRACVMEVVGAMSEAMDKRPRLLCADIGIETDEDAGVNLKEL